jgi:hypothetical protein
VALELGVGGEHGVQQRARRQVVGDEVGDDLGVRLAREARPAVAEGLAQRQVVLHDAVDHDVHAVRRVEVGVGVGLVDAPVRRPAGVADARGRLLRGDRHAAPLRLEGVDRGLEAVEVPDGPHGVDPAVGQDRDPGGVVAPVLELAQAAEQELLHRAPAHVADDAAHDARP